MKLYHYSNEKYTVCNDLSSQRIDTLAFLKEGNGKSRIVIVTDNAMVVKK